MASFSSNLYEPLQCAGYEWEVQDLHINPDPGWYRHGIKMYKRACILEVLDVKRQMFRPFVMLFPFKAFNGPALRPYQEDRLCWITRNWAEEYLSIHTEPTGRGFGDKPLYIEYSPAVQDGDMYEPEYIVV